MKLELARIGPTGLCPPTVPPVRHAARLSPLIDACGADWVTIHADRGPAGMTRCESTVAITDAGLGAELAERHPEAFARMTARQRFMRAVLGIDVASEVLPFSVVRGVMPPFWLAPELAIRRIP